MKLERNQCAAALQNSSIQGTEINEKLKMSVNETNTLSFDLQIRNHELFKLHKLQDLVLIERNQCLANLGKLKKMHNQQLDHQNKLVWSISKYQVMINQIDEEIRNIRKSKEINSQFRNDQTNLFIERNQQIYIIEVNDFLKFE